MHAAIRAAFPKRTLFTLPRPAADEHLARIASNPGRAHRAFNHRVNELRDWVGGGRWRQIQAPGVRVGGAPAPMFTIALQGDTHMLAALVSDYACARL